MWSYWKTVFTRAGRDTRAMIGSNLHRTIIIALITAIAIGALSYCESGAEAFAKFEWWALMLGSELVVFLLFFFPMLIIKTPYVIFRELEDALEQTKTSLTSEVEKMTSDLAEARNANDRAKTRDPKSIAVRGELVFFRKEFERIRQSLNNNQSHAVDAFYDIDVKTIRYIQANISSYNSHDRKYPYKNTYTKQVHYQPHEFQSYVRVCDDRIEQLDQLIDMHS